ncbi:unnamed protein product [Rhizophagus irregularis]|nr:unnamed protein product [Rhizophagus irregularis]
MDDPSDVDYEKDDIILKKKYEDYQIVICRDGKFVVTFDTVDEDMKNNVNNYDYKERYSKKKKFEFSLKAMLRLSEKFEYPQSIKRKLNNWYTDTDDGCMKRLLSSIYDKYFLVTKYKKDSQLREVYNLVNMELETTAKRFEKENELFNFNYTIFTISSLQLCFTQGNNIIKLYCMENGESPKEDKDPEELDNFPMDIIKNIDTSLVSTSGNILQIDNDGKVSSVLKKIVRILKQRKEKVEEEKK